MAAKKKTRSSTSRRSASQSRQGPKLFGWNLVGWLESARLTQKSTAKARLIFAGSGSSHKELDRQLAELLPKWQVASLKEGKEIIRLAGPEGPIWVIRPRADSKKPERDRGLLSSRRYATARDLAGRWVQELEQLALETISLEYFEADEEEILGSLVGLELAAYTYKRALESQGLISSKLHISGVSREQLNQAINIGKAVNIARHLVNAPGNELNPGSYAEAIRGIFRGFADLKIEVWDEKRLVKEKMNLIMAVGQASAHPPRLVKLSYRPKRVAKNRAAPLAFVGKGISFDSGGLDIKPPANMRLMKKDMGGSAALVGWLYWLMSSQHKQNVDVYLPMAENSISSNSFRPGDIFVARNGKRIEIHNTDAEGRLILADALALASEQKAAKQPAAIVCVATLTGAAKIGLGADIAAYYATSEELAEQIEAGAVNFGDWVWRMPLFDGYRGLLKSSAADISHCANTPFAGSITAALFLTEFVGQLPFLHLDIYAWNDKAKGALRESGGSGQSVQTLIGFFEAHLQS